jgi:hypothetical protein
VDFRFSAQSSRSKSTILIVVNVAYQPKPAIGQTQLPIAAVDP